MLVSFLRMILKIYGRKQMSSIMDGYKDVIDDSSGDKKVDKHVKGVVKDIAEGNLTQMMLDEGFEWAVVVFEDHKIWHICGYEKEPNNEALGQLWGELRTDREFHIPTETLRECQYVVVETKDLDNHINKDD